MTICYPAVTDWSCAYTAEELAVMRADPGTAAVMSRSETLAWYTLASLTAYQIGVCPVTVRPCLAGCDAPGTWMASTTRGSGYSALPQLTIGRFTPHIGVSGQWVNSCGCSSAGDCSCTALCEAILPGPVGTIEKVLVGGVALPATAYRVDNGNRLVRTDGDCWPACQDMSAPGGVSYPPITISTGTISKATFVRTGNLVTVTVVEANPNHIGGGNFVGTAPFTTDTLVQVATSTGGTFSMSQAEAISGGSPAGFAPFSFVYITPQAATAVDRSDVFEVTYYRGAAPNELTEYAAGVLAAEFFKACSGDKCRLPSGVTSVSRQGVSFQIVAGSFPGGFTGIHEVDAVIRIFNPNALTAPAKVISPDRASPRQTTWAQL